MTAETYMQRCLELAERAKGHTAPNPMVGAVLVHDRRIIGEGWHRQYGQAHAEVACLENVVPEDRHLIPQSTMYVSLEPCAHYGKTPPCAERLVQERVREVVICNRDPFAQVSGRGIAMLEAAGLSVTTGILEAAGQWLNRRFFHFHQQQRPYIILKWAQSAAAFLAPADRSRVQLSNAFSQRLVHRWRTEEAAILVGYRTALHDNPRLNARLWEGPQPLRLVIDRYLSLPASHHLLDGSQPTWVINERQDRTAPNLEQIRLPFDSSMIPALVQRLYEQKKLSLIIEGGAALLSQFIQCGLWDEARVFRTPVGIMAGLQAPVLTNGVLALETPLDDDRLQLWVNRDGPYPYAAGMSL